MSLRLICWNVNGATWQHRRRFATGDDHRRAAWEALGAFGADLAMIQEAVPPPSGSVRPPTMTLPEGEDRGAWRSLPGPRRWWCSALASWAQPLQPLDPRDDYEPLDIVHQGTYRAGVIPWRASALLVISVYALWDYAGGDHWRG